MEKRLYYRAEPDINAQYTIIEREKYSQGNWFLTKAEAKADYVKAYEIAKSKYSQLMEAFSKIKKEIVDFDIDYYMRGDTYGIYESGSYIHIAINGYNFMFLQ